MKFCPNLHPIKDFDEEAVLGLWYIHEYIYHIDNNTITEYNPYCPIIQIRKFEDYVSGGLINRDLPTPPTPYPPLTNSPYLNRAYGLPEQYRIRHFVLEWHEGLWQDDYHIKVNTSHKGFWPTDVPNGSVDKIYRFFGGVIQVLKVSHNHLVLNFCMRLPHSQLYSVVLSRNENQLTSEDLASIHNIFSIKNLSTSSLKRVCENSAISVKSSSVNMDDVYGVWYGVGYAQHNPDMTNKPNEVGCVTLYISDASDEINYTDNYIDWLIPRGNFTDQKWRSSKSNPWSGDSLAGSWMDIRLKRRAKRDLFGQKQIRVLWDEDGHTMEQDYLYYPEEPGFWTANTMSTYEREMKARGVEVWNPDDPPRHPDVIRLLKVTPFTLILNHCSEIGDGGIFSLVLRRTPSRVERWEWYQYKQQFFKFDLPNVYRYTAVCASCVDSSSLVIVLFCLSLTIIQRFL
ncbi:unnamed protein product [Colias eurytheme]|nr:unnamed protein product [Colias eurytheme]